MIIAHSYINMNLNKKTTDISDNLDNIDIDVYNENLRKYNKILKYNSLFQNIQNNFLNYY
jgi:hypothetical protein